MSFKGWETETIIKKLNKKISNVQAYNILESVGDMIVRDTVKRLSTNQVKPKTSTKTLAARRYIKGRTAKYPEGITLVAKGDLITSIRKKVYISKKRVRIGTNLVYARIQQEGGRTGRNKSVKLPSRPYLFFTGVNHILIRRMISKAFNS